MIAADLAQIAHARRVERERAGRALIQRADARP